MIVNFNGEGGVPPYQIFSKNFRGDGLQAVASLCRLRETFSLSLNILNDQMIQMTK